MNFSSTGLKLVLNTSRELTCCLRAEVATTAAGWREEGKDVPPSDRCHWHSSPVPPQLLMAIASASLGSLDKVLVIIFSVFVAWSWSLRTMSSCSNTIQGEFYRGPTFNAITQCGRSNTATTSSQRKRAQAPWRESLVESVLVCTWLHSYQCCILILVNYCHLIIILKVNIDLKWTTKVTSRKSDMREGRLCL